MLESDIGFRSLSKVLSIENRQYMDYRKTPTNTTLSNWIYKVGYHELTRVKPKGCDWIIILDHSIQMSSSKILVIYGIRLCEYDFSRALTYTDLYPLRIKIRTSWNAQDIKDELVNLQEEIGPICYAVADYCSNLRKGLELSGIPHVHDLSRKIALLLDKRYKADPIMKEFNNSLSAMRSKLVQSDLAHLVPVAARKKSVFQNMGKTAQWALKVLNAFNHKKITQKEKQALDWIVEYQPLIRELNELDQAVCQIQHVLKSNGLSKKTFKKVKEIIEERKLNLTTKGKAILTQIADYCLETLKLAGKESQIICSSDIIESAFGKYKNFSSDNKMACVTKMVLTLAAITIKPTPEQVKEIMEKVKLADIDKWDKQNIGQTTFKRRLDLLSVA